MSKNEYTKSRILDVKAIGKIVKERSEPRGRAANYGGLSSPPAAAKNVRTILSIRSQMVELTDRFLNGKLLR